MGSRKETVLDLAKWVDKGVRVKLTGGREGAQGVGRALMLRACEWGVRAAAANDGMPASLNFSPPSSPPLAHARPPFASDGNA